MKINIAKYMFKFLHRNYILIDILLNILIDKIYTHIKNNLYGLALYENFARYTREKKQKTWIICKQKYFGIECCKPVRDWEKWKTSHYKDDDSWNKKTITRRLVKFGTQK